MRVYFNSGGSEYPQTQKREENICAMFEPLKKCILNFGT